MNASDVDFNQTRLVKHLHTPMDVALMLWNPNLSMLNYVTRAVGYAVLTNDNKYRLRLCPSLFDRTENGTGPLCKSRPHSASGDTCHAVCDANGATACPAKCATLVAADAMTRFNLGQFVSPMLVTWRPPTSTSITPEFQSMLLPMDVALML